MGDTLDDLLTAVDQVTPQKDKSAETTEEKGSTTTESTQASTTASATTSTSTTNEETQGDKNNDNNQQNVQQEQVSKPKAKLVVHMNVISHGMQPKVKNKKNKIKYILDFLLLSYIYPPTHHFFSCLDC